MGEKVPARFDLARAKSFVKAWRDGDDSCIFFSNKRKSYGAVSHVCKVDSTTGMTIVAKGLQQLQPQTFCEQTYLSGRNEVADVYGLEAYNGHNWYIKFYLATEDGDDYLDAVSFHPLDNAMTCESGKRLGVTYRGDRPWS
jgi:hypothetical protein